MGATFTEEDVKHAKNLISAISRVKWDCGFSAGEMVSVGKSLEWFQNHLKVLKDNVFEVVRVIDPPQSEGQKE
jgi:hypothetical protein